MRVVCKILLRDYVTQPQNNVEVKYNRENIFGQMHHVSRGRYLQPENTRKSSQSKKIAGKKGERGGGWSYRIRTVARNQGSRPFQFSPPKIAASDLSYTYRDKERAAIRARRGRAFSTVEKPIPSAPKRTRICCSPATRPAGRPDLKAQNLLLS